MCFFCNVFFKNVLRIPWISWIWKFIVSIRFQKFFDSLSLEMFYQTTIALLPFSDSCYTHISLLEIVQHFTDAPFIPLMSFFLSLFGLVSSTVVLSCSLAFSSALSHLTFIWSSAFFLSDISFFISRSSIWDLS